MPELTDEDRNILLELARSTIAAELIKGAATKRPSTVSTALQEKRGCFVTLHKKGVLRGCIGTIEPVRSLYANVEENALNSAFKDPRFPPVEKEELAEIDIEISVLSVPRPLQFKDGQDLLDKLKPGIHGVILSKGWPKEATFLPQVWDQLPQKKSFLEHLCLKGNMNRSCWMDKDLVVKVYEAEYFGESGEKKLPSCSA